MLPPDVLSERTNSYIDYDKCLAKIESWDASELEKIRYINDLWQLAGIAFDYEIAKQEREAALERNASHEA